MQHTKNYCKKYRPFLKTTNLNLYIIILVSAITLLGCKTFVKYQEGMAVKHQAKSILKYPDLSNVSKSKPHPHE